MVANRHREHRDPASRLRGQQRVAGIKTRLLQGGRKPGELHHLLGAGRIGNIRANRLSLRVTGADRHELRVQAHETADQWIADAHLHGPNHRLVCNQGQRVRIVGQLRLQSGRDTVGQLANLVERQLPVALALLHQMPDRCRERRKHRDQHQHDQLQADGFAAQARQRRPCQPGTAIHGTTDRAGRARATATRTICPNRRRSNPIDCKLPVLPANLRIGCRSAPVRQCVPDEGRLDHGTQGPGHRLVSARLKAYKY